MQGENFQLKHSIKWNSGQNISIFFYLGHKKHVSYTRSKF